MDQADTHDNHQPKLLESRDSTCCSALHITGAQSVLEKERQGERKGRREEGAPEKSWLATVKPKSPKATTYSKF